jgi:hypothetical protein
MTDTQFLTVQSPIAAPAVSVVLAVQAPAQRAGIAPAER